MVNAFLWIKYKTDPQWKRVRLGVLPTKFLARAYKVILRWADAIVLHDGRVKIIEAKLRPDPTAIGQLEFYKKLFRVTPEFSAYKNWPIDLVMLTARSDLQMIEHCSDKGIEFELFTEDDWLAFWKSGGKPGMLNSL